MRCGLVSDTMANLLSDPAGLSAAAQRKGDVGIATSPWTIIEPRSEPCGAGGPRIAGETRIPRLAQLLEALQEGFDPLRRYLDDVVHGCPPAMLLRHFMLS